MKKIAVIFSIFLLSASVIFAGEFKPELHTNPSVRQQGFGGFYTSDIDNFYGMYANPAALGKRRVHSLFPGLNVQVGGPLKDSVNIVNAFSSMDSSAIADIINRNNGLNLNLNVEPLLSFGHISGFGFGWGFTTQAFVNATVPGIALADMNAGVEAVLTLGFAFPIINSDNLLLSVGATAKGFVQGATGYTGSLTDLMNTLTADPSSMPLYISTGFSFDAGVFLSICNTIDVSATYYDPFSMVFVSNGTIGGPSFEFDFANVKQLDPRLAVGVAYHIPVAWTNSVITSFKVMADYRNFYTLFGDGHRNPWLELSCGTELVLANIVSFRFGMSEMLPAAGIGFKFGTFNIDMSMYGKELGLEPGSAPCLNAAVFIGFTY